MDLGLKGKKAVQPNAREAEQVGNPNDAGNKFPADWECVS